MAKTEVSKQLNREIREMLRVIVPEGPKKRHKTVKTPLAVSTKYSEPGDHLEKVSSAIQSGISKLKEVDKRVYYIACLLYENGLRISEVLGIKSYHIGINGMIIIKGLKGSNDRLIHGGTNVAYYEKCRVQNISPFEGLDYYYVYRTFKKVGISASIKGNDRKVVTHSLRHLHIAELKKMGTDNEVIATHIGHKNSDNTANYGKIT